MSKAKVDCFAYMEVFNKPVCNALKEMQCLKGKCRFYKNRKDINYTQIETDIKNYIKGNQS